VKFPPDNYQQLREIVSKLRQGEIELAIGKKSFHALERMLDDADLVAMNNIVNLGQAINLSSASITRLAKLLGFRGFQQFQQIFKQKSKLANSFYSDGINRLLQQSPQSPLALIKQQSLAVITNIEDTLATLDEDSLMQAKSLLAKKNRVHIFAYRHFSAIANMLRYGLALIRPNVQMLVQESHGVAIALGQLKKEDLLVVIGSAPYSNITLKIASLASRQQCQILAITDTNHSPLTDIATVAVNIPSAKHFYSNSLVTNSFIVEALLSLTALELGGTALNHLQRHELLLSQLEVST